MDFFDPFKWAQDVLSGGWDVKRILFAGAVTFGALVVLDDFGVPMMGFVAILIAATVLIWGQRRQQPSSPNSQVRVSA